MERTSDFVEKVKRVLEGNFPRADVRLEKSAGRKVGGFLVWPGFRGKEQIKRQEKLWKVLDRTLKKDEQLRITAILTATPEEMAVMSNN